MTKAKKLLLETDFSIAVVAGECGFANQNYFSKLFKRETGLSPTAFRAQHR
jgi:AraC family transcriptional regulator of adaptative response / methylphosphotriester-DNA alkyltransferase methyltransferase